MGEEGDEKVVRIKGLDSGSFEWIVFCVYYCLLVKTTFMTQ